MKLTGKLTDSIVKLIILITPFLSDTGDQELV
jgi:hypothetical protein